MREKTSSTNDVGRPLQLSVNSRLSDLKLGGLVHGRLLTKRVSQEDFGRSIMAYSILSFFHLTPFTFSWWLISSLINIAFPSCHLIHWDIACSSEPRIYSLFSTLALSPTIPHFKPRFSVLTFLRDEPLNLSTLVFSVPLD